MPAPLVRERKYGESFNGESWYIAVNKGRDLQQLTRQGQLPPHRKTQWHDYNSIRNYGWKLDNNEVPNNFDLRRHKFKFEELKKVIPDFFSPQDKADTFVIRDWVFDTKDIDMPDANQGINTNFKLSAPGHYQVGYDVKALYMVFSHTYNPLRHGVSLSESPLNKLSDMAYLQWNKLCEEANPSLAI
jgi:hypothetical protein